MEREPVGVHLDTEDESVTDLDKSEPAPAPSGEAGGVSACLAHLLCPDCGVVLDGSPHHAGCASAA